MRFKQPALLRHVAQHLNSIVATNTLTTAALALGLLLSCPANARYVADNSTYPNGVADISMRGDVAIAPAALYTSVDGNAFVTGAQRDDALAACAYTTGAALQESFGSSGCHRATLAANEYAYQLLVGKSGYWVFIVDASNPKRFSLLRLSKLGQPDTSYGPLGRRSFELTCDAGDAATRCPEIRGGGAQQLLNTTPFIAETGGTDLWLLASRQSSGGAYEGVVFRIEQGRDISTRATLFDALPAIWTPDQQQFAYMPIGVVAHGDGVLVEHRTDHGYALLRVGANGAVDRGFGSSQTNGIILAGDGALPFWFFQMPVVAADNTFYWGLNLEGRTRFDQRGATLGTLATARSEVIAAPDSFASASTALWLADGTRVGRWQNGQWDMTTFGGKGPYEPPTNQTLFALTRDTATLAMLNAPTAVITPALPAQLSIVGTQASPQVLVAPAVLQSGALLTANGPNWGIDPAVALRHATQADGKTVWQRITIDPLGTAADVATGTLAALPSGSLDGLLVSGASTSGARWAVRTLTPDMFKPSELYADLIGANPAPRRVNMDAIRAEMPPFFPGAPFSNPQIINLDIAADGSALALIRYPRGTVSAYRYRLAQLRWNVNSLAGNDYLPQIEWSFELGTDAFLFTAVQRDAQGRLLLIDTDGSRIRRISAQGVLDTSFGQTGILDLKALGFSGTNLILSLLNDGSAWIGNASRLVRIDGNGQVTARVSPAPQAPNNYSSTALVFSGLLAEADGSVLVLSTPSRPASPSSRSYRLLRYTPAGELDTQFGLRGAETLVINGSANSPSILSLANRGLAAIADNALSLFRYDPSLSGSSGATVAVVEFYNSTLNHYFMTAEADEIAGIDAGAAGPGWTRTGQTFRAYANLNDAPGDALDICRFYGSAVPLTRSPNGRTGPNSHFYTFVGPECDGIYKSDQAWQFEGTRLALVPALADNSCATGQQPVIRAYNNGYEARDGVWIKNDSNHRYATSRAIIAEMVGKGWVDEGLRFCAPQ